MFGESVVLEKNNFVLTFLLSHFTSIYKLKIITEEERFIHVLYFKTKVFEYTSRHGSLNERMWVDH